MLAKINVAYKRVQVAQCSQPSVEQEGKLNLNTPRLLGAAFTQRLREGVPDLALLWRGHFT